MKKTMAVVGAVCAASVAVPAQADEGRVELRLGHISTSDDFGSGVAGGLAAGYDFDLNDKTFIGVEAYADVVATDFIGASDGRAGVSARAGIKTGADGESGKLYATAGFDSADNGGAIVGAGYQLHVTKLVYVKAEYRRFFANGGSDHIFGGIGVRF